MQSRLVFSLITVVAALIAYHSMYGFVSRLPPEFPFRPSPPHSELTMFLLRLWSYAVIVSAAGLVGAVLAPLWSSCFWGRLFATVLTPSLFVLLMALPDMFAAMLSGAIWAPFQLVASAALMPLLMIIVAGEFPAGLIVWTGGSLVAWIAGRIIAARRERAAREAAGMNSGDLNP